MIIICNNDAPIFLAKNTPISCLSNKNRIKLRVLQINPKKFKEIKNKTIPNPLRPKFRKKAQSNIYFLSQRKVSGEKRIKFVKNIKLLSIISLVLVGGYFLTN